MVSEYESSKNELTKNLFYSIVYLPDEISISKENKAR